MCVSVCVCVFVCVPDWASACVHMLVYVVINLFLAIIALCLNTFIYVYLTLNYRMFNLNFIYFTCYTDGMFQSKFPFAEQ